ncbi:MAG: hypothetical protein MPJ78_13260 [Hyphomicrobiaceae bacterium]|nr:hypothetical protein [Hyphomicrobiaceae bacterium]
MKGLLMRNLLLRHFRNVTCSLLFAGLIISPAFAAELKWTFHAAGDVGQAFLSDCVNCDGAMFTAVCRKGRSVTVIPVMDVKGGAVGEKRNVTFLFGDGAVEVESVLVENLIDDTVEPEIKIPSNHEIFDHMRTFKSVEVMVDRGPNLVVPLKGASEVIGKLQAFCRK